MPLSSLYYARYMNGGTFSGGTDLVVWRDNRRAAVAPPLRQGARPGRRSGEMQIVIFDEEENPRRSATATPSPLATQKVHVGGAALPSRSPSAG